MKACTDFHHTLETEPTHPLFARNFIRNQKLPHAFKENTQLQFSLVTYNILADCNALKGKDHWGAYQFIDREQLKIQTRHPRLMKEIMFLKPDIVCLQEVDEDYFNGLLSPEMAKYGFEGFYVNRFLVEPWMTEGEAVFYKTSVFSVKYHENHVLHEIAKQNLTKSSHPSVTQEAVLNALKESAVVLICTMVHIPSGKTLNLANTHISWGWLKRPDVQCAQLSCCLEELLRVAGGDNVPHIICGDFNSTPDTPNYQLLRDGRLTEENKCKLSEIKTVALPGGEQSSIVDVWPDGLCHNSATLKSAYKMATGVEPMSSAFPHDNGLRAVDYIWFSSQNLDLIGVHETVPIKFMTSGTAGMPNEICPSDHLSLQATLQFQE